MFGAHPFQTPKGPTSALTMILDRVSAIVWKRVHFFWHHRTCTEVEVLCLNLLWGVVEADPSLRAEQGSPLQRRRSRVDLDGAFLPVVQA